MGLASDGGAACDGLGPTQARPMPSSRTAWWAGCHAGRLKGQGLALKGGPTSGLAKTG